MASNAKILGLLEMALIALLLQLDPSGRDRSFSSDRRAAIAYPAVGTSQSSFIKTCGMQPHLDTRGRLRVHANLAGR
jgi:hypothetical protein